MKLKTHSPKASTLMALLFAFLLGCSHSLKPVKLTSTGTASGDLEAQNALMVEAQNAQVDVLAPEHFEDAQKYFSKAKKEEKSGSSTEEILETLGYSKAHLDAATQKAKKSQASLGDITTARTAAMRAGGRNTIKLSKLDDEFKGYTSKDSPMENEDKIKLQEKYLNLELFMIKNNKLTALRKSLEEARNKGAEEITPKAYAVAMAKYNSAEKIIETDRHSDAQIDPIVISATFQAKRVNALLDSEKTTRDQTPEQRALALEAKDIALSKSVAEENITEAASLRKDRELETQGQTLALTESQNTELRQKELDNRIVAQAAAQFKKNEADVYTQNGVLIIRLKSMNFASGRSDLPSDSIAVLNKVKEVIKEVDSPKITVEGHTDAVGGKEINQTLSEQRAKSVATFMTADNILASSEVGSVGYGYSKPLATNKTKEGRAQNRRVDILIKTNNAL